MGKKYLLFIKLHSISTLTLRFSTLEINIKLPALTGLIAREHQHLLHHLSDLEHTIKISGLALKKVRCKVSTEWADKSSISKVI